MQNVTKYAEIDYFECFAEAFTAWCCYSARMMDEHPFFTGFSRSNVEWFDRLLAV